MFTLQYGKIMKRRDFLYRLTGSAALLSIPASLLAGMTGLTTGTRDRLGELMPTRILGNTGEKVTIFGLGGFHTRAKFSDRDAQEALEYALEQGVRFFDTAESYSGGRSEELYGKILTPKYRDVAYLMTKTRARDARTAREHLEGSLRRMKTDYLDLWQIHSVSDAGDVDHRIENGVLEYLLKAREEGKVRHIGFSGHRELSAHKRMLEITDVLQTCQMPVNVLDPSNHSFIKEIMPALIQKNMGILAMKTAANGELIQTAVKSGKLSMRELHHFVLSLPVSTLIAGFDNLEQLKERIAHVRSFAGLTEEEREAITKRVAYLAEPDIHPDVEYYKYRW